MNSDLPTARVKPVVLSIAGFDPSGGAGVTRDIQTFAAFGCIATAAVTSLTIQSDEAVSGAAHQPAEVVRSQVMTLAKSMSIAAVKTGMLPTRDVVFELAKLFRAGELPAPVVDPVWRSSSGYELVDNEAMEAITKELMPLARVVTPNIPEAERISGQRIENLDDMRRVARAIRAMGARAVLLKGGHLQQTESEGRAAIDVLDDEGRVRIFQGEWIEGDSMRGTGCILSSGIAACLAHGLSLEASVEKAREFVAEAIRSRSTWNADLP